MSFRSSPSLRTSGSSSNVYAEGAGAGAGASGADSTIDDAERAVLVGGIWDEATVEEEHRSAVAKLRAQREHRRKELLMQKAIIERGPGHVTARALPRGRAARSPSFDRPKLPPRELKNLYIAQVGRFHFKTMHRMEGRWNGEATVLGASSGSEHRVVSVDLRFDDDERRWVERQTLTSSSGLATTQILHYEPTADGVLKVTTDDSSLDDVVDMRIVEHGDSVLILTAISHTTSQPLIVETVTLIDDLRRVRSIQRFDASGNFSLYSIKEQRVIDSVSGAVEEFHTRTGTRRV